MQHTLQHTAEFEIFPENIVEIELTITYEFHPAERGTRGDFGEPIEPDEESRIEILSITDTTGKEYQPEEIENIYSLCWDNLEN